MLGLLGVFLINNQITLVFDWPGITALFEDGEAPPRAWLQLGFYVAVTISAIVLAMTTRQRTLRADATLISGFNAYLVRGAFWAVFLIGLTDMAISLLRVEGFLVGLAGEQLATDLGRSIYRGSNVHVPLMAAGFVIALFSRSLGFVWLALLIVIAELAIVFTRFVFSYEQAFMGDLVRLWYAALFLFASAYTLLAEAHVRVDVFYAGFSARRKGLVNAIGTVLLGMSMCWVILIVGMDGKAAIINSPVLNFEVSQSGFGMYTKYLMAAFLGLFAITMLVEFVAYTLSAVANYRGDPGARPIAASTTH
ncbi:MAG: TRAP transporter small permease subunit [Gammaproteobacteria bacterium]|nr:TRAP transporter small permease subunit [Gammaproteobacteria bacterium]